MKVKGVVRAALVVCVLAVFALFGAELSVAAVTPADSLPVVKQWFNGAAKGEDGLYLYDTWAVDETGVSESKYVLIDQNSLEVFRVNKYPEDMEAGNTIAAPLHKLEFQLTVPEGLTEEVLVTFENNVCVYTISLTKDNEYQGQFKVYPGEYKVSDVEVPAAGKDVAFQLAKESSFVVSDDNLSVSLELQKNVVAESGNAESAENAPSGESGGVNVFETISGFDKNGDLLKDTVTLIFWIIVLFVVYGVIKWRRKKKEELNR